MPDPDYTDKPRPAKPHFRVFGWKAIDKGSVLGVCNVEIELMRIIGVLIMRKSGGELWASLPSKPQLDRDKKQRLNDADKPMYDEVIAWRSKEIADRFSARVLAELRAQRIDLDGATQPIRQDALGEMLERT